MIKQLCAILIMILLLTSCAPSRRMNSTIVMKQDTTVGRDSMMGTSVTHSNTYTQRKDTAIGVSAKEITTKFSPEDLQPVYTKEGKAVARAFHKDTGGISMTVIVHPDGSVNMKCKADSLTLVVKNLDSTVVSIHDSIGYWRGQYALKSITATSEIKDTKVYDWVYYLKWAGLAAIVLAIIVFLINRFL